MSVYSYVLWWACSLMSIWICLKTKITLEFLLWPFHHLSTTPLFISIDEEMDWFSDTAEEWAQEQFKTNGFGPANVFSAIEGSSSRDKMPCPLVVADNGCNSSTWAHIRECPNIKNNVSWGIRWVIFGKWRKLVHYSRSLQRPLGLEYRWSQPMYSIASYFVR